MAGEGGRMEGASEGGEGEEEEVGDAGVCIAACKVLASPRPAAEVAANPIRRCCESISPGACVSVHPSPFECVSVRPRRVFLWPATCAMLEPLTVSVCLKGFFASLCPSVCLTERREAARKTRKRWKEGVRRDARVDDVRSESPPNVWD